MGRQERMGEMNEKLCQEYAELYDSVKAKRARMAEIKEVLAEEVNYHRRQVRQGRVLVTYLKGREKAVWDTSALLRLAAKYPEILEHVEYKKIKPIRTVRVSHGCL